MPCFQHIGVLARADVKHNLITLRFLSARISQQIINNIYWSPCTTTFYDGLSLGRIYVIVLLIF